MGLKFTWNIPYTQFFVRKFPHSLFPEWTMNPSNRFHNSHQLLIAATVLQDPFYAQKKVREKEIT
jgi:hypothetical protein